jgi:hypothetical protein
MTATINWTIQQLDRKTADGFVTTAHWRCDATDGEFSAGVYGSAGFTGDLTIPYENLTQEQVLGWCWNNGVDKDAVESGIQSQINSQINPTVIQPPLPWAAPAA